MHSCPSLVVRLSMLAQIVNAVRYLALSVLAKSRHSIGDFQVNAAGPVSTPRVFVNSEFAGPVTGRRDARKE